MFERIRRIDNRVIIAFSFVFFIFTMAFNLMHSALWGDEWIEFCYSQASISNGDLYNRIISTFQPPLYNFVMHFWLKVSQSVIWFRFFNVIVGFFGGLLLFSTVNKLYSVKESVIALLILSVCYHWVFCIQECSEYALMLCFLFAVLREYVYLNCTFKYRYLIFMILFAVLAVYSQYGAVFVVLPVLLVFFISSVFSRKSTLKQRVIIIGSYVLSFLFFACPLYLFFARHQLQNNKISPLKHELSISMIAEMPLVFGKIVGFLFNIPIGDYWPIREEIVHNMNDAYSFGENTGVILTVILSIIGLGILASAIALLTYRDLEWVKKSLIVIMLICYVLFYILVKLRVYAMIHPDESYGFYSRYSYFFIPILSIVLPIVVIEVRNKRLLRLSKVKEIILTIVLIVILMTSFVSVMVNWHKSYDDVFAKIWSENKGWEDTTFLYGYNYGALYYIKRTDGYREEYINSIYTIVDNNNLPEKFWAWRSNWGGDNWEETIEKARSLGYEVIVYEDSGSAGQLAYCYKDDKA